MAHKRCTGCKEEVGRYGIRHKYFGGVFCESCIRWIRGFRPHTRVRSWWGSIWDKIVDFATSVFQGKTVKRVGLAKEMASHAHMKAMNAKARSIPYNPQGRVPQKI